VVQAMLLLISKQQGRNGTKRGAFEGKKERKKSRRSKRCKPSESSSNDEDDISLDEDSKLHTQVKPPSLRNQPINCLTFGKLRHHQFPDHFFCGECDVWERQGVGGDMGEDAIHFRKSAKRSSRNEITNASQITRP
jgi:hypothetical protein